MSRKDSVGGASTTGDRRQNSIQPLPEEVVAQIKSSTAIVSLAGVVLELLANSLDGGATRIEATVDFARGGCTVEDDGLGIAPFEFGEDGGLGKLYCSSTKLHAIYVLILMPIRHFQVLVPRPFSRLQRDLPCLSCGRVPSHYNVASP
jgi:DNA mismatch repair protein MLH3